jgi:hypothetical protein
MTVEFPDDDLPDDDTFCCECGRGPAPAIKSPGPRQRLDREREGIPKWLGFAETPSATMLRECLASRTVFYPGSGTDGQAMKMFCSSHAAHCVIHADLNHDADGLIADLRAIRGYSLVAPLIMSGDEVYDVLDLETRHPYQGNPRLQHAMNYEPQQPLRFAIVALLHRQPDFKNDHGPERLAFIHFGAEAVWVFWNLWARRPEYAPYAVVLQDHGFGGNWTTFGCQRGALYDVARNGTLSEWLLVARNTCPWPGYEVASAWSERAGQGGFRRRLMRRVTT